MVAEALQQIQSGRKAREGDQHELVGGAFAAQFTAIKAAELRLYCFWIVRAAGTLQIALLADRAK